MSNAPPSPAERLAALLRCLAEALAALAGDRVTRLLLAQILAGLDGIGQHLASLAAQTADAGTEPATPPHRAATRPPGQRRSRTHNVRWPARRGANAATAPTPNRRPARRQAGNRSPPPRPAAHRPAPDAQARPFHSTIVMYSAR